MDHINPNTKPTMTMSEKESVIGKKIKMIEQMSKHKVNLIAKLYTNKCSQSVVLRSK